MRGGLQPRDPVRDEKPRGDWLLFLFALFVIAALYAGLR